MLTTLFALLPVVAALVTGRLLRWQSLAGRAQGQLVFRVVFTVCLPALLFTSIARVQLTHRLAVFALAAPVVVVAGYSVARGSSPGRRCSRATRSRLWSSRP